MSASRSASPSSSGPLFDDSIDNDFDDVLAIKEKLKALESENAQLKQLMSQIDAMTSVPATEDGGMIDNNSVDVGSGRIRPRRALRPFGTLSMASTGSDAPRSDSIDDMNGHSSLGVSQQLRVSPDAFAGVTSSLGASQRPPAPGARFLLIRRSTTVKIVPVRADATEALASVEVCWNPEPSVRFEIDVMLQESSLVVHGHVSDATLRQAAAVLGLPCAAKSMWHSAILRSSVALEVAEAVIAKLVLVQNRHSEQWRVSLDIDTAAASMDVSSSMLMLDADSMRASAPVASSMERKLASDKSVRGVLGVAVIRFVDTGTPTPPDSAQLYVRLDISMAAGRRTVFTACVHRNMAGYYEWAVDEAGVLLLPFEFGPDEREAVLTCTLLDATTSPLRHESLLSGKLSVAQLLSFQLSPTLYNVPLDPSRPASSGSSTPLSSHRSAATARKGVRPTLLLCLSSVTRSSDVTALRSAVASVATAGVWVADPTMVDDVQKPRRRRVKKAAPPSRKHRRSASLGRRRRSSSPASKAAGSRLMASKSPAPSPARAGARKRLVRPQSSSALVRAPASASAADQLQPAAAPASPRSAPSESNHMSPNVAIPSPVLAPLGASAFQPLDQSVSFLGESNADSAVSLHDESSSLEHAGTAILSSVGSHAPPQGRPSPATTSDVSATDTIPPPATTVVAAPLDTDIVPTGLPSHLVSTSEHSVPMASPQLAVASPHARPRAGSSPLAIVPSETLGTSAATSLHARSASPLAARAASPLSARKRQPSQHVELMLPVVGGGTTLLHGTVLLKPMRAVIAADLASFVDSTCWCMRVSISEEPQCSLVSAWLSCHPGATSFAWSTREPHLEFECTCPSNAPLHLLIELLTAPTVPTCTPAQWEDAPDLRLFRVAGDCLLEVREYLVAEQSPARLRLPLRHSQAALDGRSLSIGSLDISVGSATTALV